MFEKQKIILTAIPTIREIAARYPSWQPQNPEWIDTRELQAENFVVPVPLVGAFSAGKSTLVNCVIGESILSANIDPETAIPAEVWHSATECIQGRMPNGQRLPLTREALLNNQMQPLQHGGVVEVALPIPPLQDLPHIKLVDMPGWDSGIQAHSAAIDNYAAQSLAYGIAVSADEGTLHESIRTALRELGVREMPVFLVLTKADKKPAEEIHAICRQIATEIEQAIGKPPFRICVTSARKKDFQQFLAALDDIESRTELMFTTEVVRPFTRQVSDLRSHLSTLINSDDLDSEKIAIQCAQVEAEMQTFTTHLLSETAALEQRVKPVMGRIQQRMEARLMGQLDSLTSNALGGHDLSGPIGTALRLAVEEGMRDDFNPEVERYLGRVAEGLPETFRPNTSTLDINTRSGGEPFASSTALPAVLTSVLPFLANLHPVARIVAMLAPILFGLFKNKADKDAEENRRREEALQHIRNTVIPAALAQASEALLPVLRASVAQAKKIISDNVEAQKRSHEAALAELQSLLAQGQTAFARQREKYKADQTALTYHLNTLQ